MQGSICPGNSSQETSERIFGVVEDAGDILPDKPAKRSGVAEGMGELYE